VSLHEHTLRTNRKSTFFTSFDVGDRCPEVEFISIVQVIPVSPCGVLARTDETVKPEEPFWKGTASFKLGYQPERVSVRFLQEPWDSPTADLSIMKD